MGLAAASGPVTRHGLVAGLVVVRCPFPDISSHVADPLRRMALWLGTNRLRSLVTALHHRVFTGGLRLAPWVADILARGPGRVFPLCLCGEGRFYPPSIGHGLGPIEAVDRELGLLVTTAPRAPSVILAGPATNPSQNTGFKLGHGHLTAGHLEGRDLHPTTGFFIGVSLLGAQQDLAGGQRSPVEGWCRGKK